MANKAILTILAVAAATTVGACTPAALPAATASSSAAQTEDPTPATPSIVVTEVMGSPHIGEAAPDFELPDQDGKPVRLSSARGSVVVLAFVASFCPFSKAEQPHLRKLAADYAGKNVKVIAIGIKEPEPDYREYVARMPTAFPVLRDADGAVTLRFLPPRAQLDFKDRTMALVSSNLVIDKSGKIRFFTVLDTVNFDAKLVHVRSSVDRVLAESGS